MLAAGAAVDAPDRRGRTPLAWAARMDAVAAAELLLQHGASSGPALAEATARDSTRVLALLQAAATAEAAPRAAVAPHGGQGPSVADEEEQAEATLQTGDLAVFLAALGIYDDYDDTFEAEGIRYVAAEL